MGRKVFITGVSRGLGEALAEHYLQADWEVLGVSRRVPQRLQEFPGFRFESLDLGDENAIMPVIDRLLPKDAAVELAILNAGVLGRLGDLTEVAVADLQATLELNVWANKRLLDVLLPAGRVQRQVVTISSGAAVNGNRGFGGYSLSKAALNMLTKLYSREYPAVHFCALAPGVIETAMQDSIGGAADDPRFEAFRRLLDLRKAGQMPSPAEAAAGVAAVIERLPERVTSGDFADVREEKFHDAYPRR